MTRRGAGAALALILVAAGCSGDDGDGEGAPPRPSRTTTSTSASTVPAGSTIRLGVPKEPGSLNPFDARSRTPAGLAILGTVLPQLFRVSPDGEAVGGLADAGSVDEADDGTSVSFSLRDGARWSDGRALSVDDIRFTLDAVRGGAWPGARAGYDRVRAVEGSGPGVTFRFDRPFPGWRRLFSGEDFVLPAHRLKGRDLKTEWAGGPDVAAGPFRLGPVTAGLEVVLVRNEEWWGSGPSVEVVRVLVVPDVRTMEQLLERGELDLAWPPAATNRVNRFRRLEGVTTSVAEVGGRIVLLVPNAEALSATERRGFLALPNRDRFVEVLLAGEAAPATALAGPQGGPNWAQAAGEPTPDGIDEEFTATLVGAEEEPMGPLLGRLLERRTRDLGGTLELKFAESPRVDGAWLAEGSFDAAVVEAVAWPDVCWRCWFGERSVGRGNVSRISGVEGLAADADRGEASAAEALETVLRERAVLLPLWRPRAVLAGRGVTGAEANSWSMGPFWKIEEWARAG